MKNITRTNLKPKPTSLRVRCETCPIRDFCYSQTYATCSLLKLISREVVGEETK